MVAETAHSANCKHHRLASPQALGHNWAIRVQALASFKSTVPFGGILKAPIMANLRAAMREQNLDALLVTHPSNRFFLSGYTADDAPPNESAGCIVITADQAYLITSGTNENQARVQAPAFTHIRRERNLAITLKTLLDRHAVKRFGFEEDAVLVSLYHTLQALVGDTVALVPIGELVSKQRLIKTPEEIALIKRAVAITDAAFEAVAARMQPDQTEREVAAALEQEMLERGADGLAFPVIVAAGANGAFAHHEPDDTPLGEGLPITIDMGAKVQGYAADLTRTVILGEPTEQARQVYRTLMRAVDITEEYLRAGLTGAEVDALARNVITEAGFGEYFGHGLGHGVGVRVHEAPSAAPGVEEVVPCGATLTIEPGIYIPGWGGARIEDLVIIEDTGVEILSQAKKQAV